MTMSVRLLLGAALLVSGAAFSVRAEVINLTYVGTPISGAGLDGTSVTGTGTVTIPDGLTNVGFGDVEGFSFTLTISGSGGTDVDNYVLGDLFSFDATLDPAGNVVSLDLTTNNDSSGNTFYIAEALSFSTGNTSFTGNADVGSTSSGSLAASPRGAGACEPDAAGGGPCLPAWG